MRLTTRDRRIVIVLAVLATVAAYWLLLLGPKRSESARLADDVAAARSERDEAAATLERLRGARTTYAADYATVVRLGKAVPEDVDMPSLLVQLERAAAATDIDFERITAGERVAAPQEPAAGEPAGGEQAASAPGQEAEGTQETASQASAGAAERSGLSAEDTQTSTTAREGALPVGGASGGASQQGAGAQAPPGLEAVPLTFSFRGSFFELADFFHRLKRYVEVANDELVVRGRLLTIDSLDFSSGGADFPRIQAQVNATAYLVPSAQGATAGATADGPAAQPASGQPPAPGAPAQGAPAAPAAAVTP